MAEISTRTEVAVSLPNGLPEMTMTVGQVERLLTAATEYAKAQRPIVIAPSTAPAVAVLPTEAQSFFAGTGYAPAQHPGINIRYPSAAEAQYVVPWAPLRHPVPARFAWGVRLVYAGIGVLLAGAAGAAVTDGNGIAVSAAVAGIGAVIGGTARATVEENQREARS